MASRCQDCGRIIPLSELHHVGLCDACAYRRQQAQTQPIVEAQPKESMSEKMARLRAMRKNHSP